MFDAIVFAVIALGFEARCALERDTGGQERLYKILDIIRHCKFGIHDISFMRVDPKIRLPRYNMAFELGVFLGCYEFGGRQHAAKSCLILDRDRFRYRKSISDLSGRDIKEHKGDPKQAIVRVRDWLATESGPETLVGGRFIAEQYERFRKQLPRLCTRSKRRTRELTFIEYRGIVASWLRANS
ncbi:MAG: nucleotide-binding protein [Acidobacteriia bacterium]|nr:nucleotide-binding protein [Terriglobia bacterium]